MRTFLTLISIILITTTAQSQVIWEQPAADKNNLIEGYFSTLAEITRVEFSKEETRVYMHLSHRPDSWLRFSKDTYLQAAGKRYPVRSCQGIELGEETYLSNNGAADVVFHFEPLPLKTEKFDFKEGDAEGDYCIMGIENCDTKAKQLFPSAWRNSDTGEWDIAFYKEYAIYDCRFWNYVQQKQKGDKYEFLLESNGEKIAIKVGKAKNSHRSITIGNKKSEYSLISSITLPDYPQHDKNTGFKDTGYRQGDTVTLTGWLRGIPKHKKARTDIYKATIKNILKAENEEYSCRLDTLGRFTIKIPLLNSSEVFMDWNITYIRNILEAGETYFLLYEFEKGHKLFMGKNARLQNEILTHPIPWNGFYIYDENTEKPTTATEVLEMYLPQLQETEDAFARKLEKHPTLSERYREYVSNNYRCQFASSMMQAVYRIKDKNLTDEYRNFIHNLLKSQPEPTYTLYRDYSTLLNDILYDKTIAYCGYRIGQISVLDYKKIYPDIFKRYRDAGKIMLTDNEIATVKEWAEKYHKLYEAHKNAKNTDELYRQIEVLDSSEIALQAKAIVERDDIVNIIKAERPMFGTYIASNIAEEQQYSSTMKDILIARKLYSSFDLYQEPLSPFAMQYIEENVKLECVKEAIKHENDKYIALNNKELRHAASLHSNNTMAALSDGEEILRKLLEPLKGKVVVIDVWGVWCGPCKAALAHSQEQYERLNKYDVAYLYLANKSDRKIWENTIKKYDATGENVHHYNLPEIQQDKIETFLKVQGYPTYKIVDKQGNILDINADLRNLDGIEEIIKKLSAE